MKRIIMVVALATSAWLAPLGGSVYAGEVQVEADEVVNEQMVTYYEQEAIGKSVWVVDSRPTGKFIAGHIPGAMSLPLDVLKKDATSADKLGISRTAKIIFYCAGRECTLSADSAAIFRKSGYTDTWVFRNGVPGWNQKAQPLLAEAAFIKKGNLILLDTAVGKDSIANTDNQVLQLSLSDLKGAKGQSVLKDLSRNAPILVLDRGNMETVTSVLEQLREMDFRRLAYIPLSAWKGALATAPVVDHVTWAPAYGPGQIAPQVFEEAVASGKYILDVRPEADFARGHFKGAVNLPIEEIEKDYTRIPMNIPVFVNCATGAKSSKAFDILGRKGYSNVVYLDAEISCKSERCTIKE